jgi:hypothetical protein
MALSGEHSSIEHEPLPTCGDLDSPMNVRGRSSRSGSDAWAVAAWRLISMLAKSAASGSAAGAPAPWALGAWKTRQRLVRFGPKQASAASTRPSEVAEQVLASRLMLVFEGTESRKS